MAITTIRTATGTVAAIYFDTAAHVIEITDSDYTLPADNDGQRAQRGDRRNSIRAGADEGGLPDLFRGKLC